MKTKRLEKILIPGILLAAMPIPFSGCSSTSYDYVKFDSSELSYLPTPRITFEHPAYFSFTTFPKMDVINVFGDEAETRCLTATFGFYSTDMDKPEQEFTEEEDPSLIIIHYCNEKSARLWRQYNKDIRDLAFDLYIVYSQYEEDIVEKPVSVGGIPARLLFVQFDNEPFEYAETNAVAYFEHEGCWWMIGWRLWNDLANKPPPYFYHLLDTFKILE